MRSVPVPSGTVTPGSPCGCGKGRVGAKAGLAGLQFVMDFSGKHHDAMMPNMAKARTTLTIDEDVLRAVKLRAAATGSGESKVIEDAVRRDLGLDTLTELWAKVEPMPERAAMELALEAQEAARKPARSKRRSKRR